MLIVARYMCTLSFYRAANFEQDSVIQLSWALLNHSHY